MRYHVKFLPQSVPDRLDAHFMEGDNLVDIRGYFLPEDHCTIGPDLHNYIMHGILPDHSAPIPHQPCNVVTSHIGRRAP
jgi:hypothetical protein